MIHTGYITAVGNGYVDMRVPIDKDYLIEHREITECDVMFCDGRAISSKQRKMIYATLGDIHYWSWHSIEEIKAEFKLRLVKKYGCDWFSLSDTDMTTAREYLNMLIEFCLKHGIHSKNPYLGRSPDTGRYLYACLIYKKCIVCNQAAELHHVDHVGMGRNRLKINHIGMEAQALCRIHHNEAHNSGQQSFDKKYHVFGIKIDKTIAKVYKLYKECKV